MTSGAASAFVTLLVIALVAAFIQGGPGQMWAWTVRTLTGKDAGELLGGSAGSSTTVPRNYGDQGPWWAPEPNLPDWPNGGRL